MSKDRPPIIDAEFEVVRPPWPRWVWQVGLWALLLRTALAVAVLILISVGLVAVFWP